MAIDHRGSQADVDDFKYSGIWLGGTWSEEVEGTNEIGMCIAEVRPVTVHRDQHFRLRHTNLSCSAAPIFDGGGKLLAVLDVSSNDPTLSERSHALTGALAQASARAIEERLFREQFRRDWILALAAPDGAGSTMLIAVDQDQRVVGADRNARMMLSRGNGDLQEECGRYSNVTTRCSGTRTAGICPSSWSVPGPPSIGRPSLLRRRAHPVHSTIRNPPMPTRGRGSRRSRGSSTSLHHPRFAADCRLAHFSACATTWRPTSRSTSPSKRWRRPQACRSITSRGRSNSHRA